MRTNCDFLFVCIFHLKNCRTHCHLGTLAHNEYVRSVEKRTRCIHAITMAWSDLVQSIIHIDGYLAHVAAFIASIHLFEIGQQWNYGIRPNLTQFDEWPVLDATSSLASWRLHLVAYVVWLFYQLVVAHFTIPVDSTLNVCVHFLWKLRIKQT